MNTATPPAAATASPPAASASMGTSIQLAAIGPQNVFLDLNPEMTFWRYTYKRHTPFARITAIELFRTGFGFGMTPARLDVPRSGDLLGDMTLELRLPALLNAGVPDPAATWTPAIGYFLLRRVRFLLNDTVVHDQERLWYDIADKLFCTSAKAAGLDAMIGREALSVYEDHLLFVPLKLLCCRDAASRSAQNWLPLMAVPTASITLEIETEAFDKCVSAKALELGATAPASLEAAVLCDCVLLDTDEQFALMEKPISLMFDQVRDCEDVTYRVSDTLQYTSLVSVDLRELNHPVRFLAAVAYDETYGTPFSYRRDVVHKAFLEINGVERFSERPAAYFELVQRYDHTQKCARDDVMVYSFSLDASQYQPSGSFNFATAKSASFRVQMKPAVAADSQRITIKVFARYVNILNVFRGEASIEFVD
jgi:hypothetical protein